MFYEQKFDKFMSVWQYRTTPKGEWLPMDYETLAWAYYNLKESLNKKEAECAQ